MDSSVMEVRSDSSRLPGTEGTVTGPGSDSGKLGLGLLPDGPEVCSGSSVKENDEVRNIRTERNGLLQPNEIPRGLSLDENEENEIAAAEVLSQTDAGDNNSEMELQNIPLRSASTSKKNVGTKSRTSYISKSTEPSQSFAVKAGTGSRSRPRKSHEPTPFLSIDNLPVSVNEETTATEYQSAIRTKTISRNSARGTPYVPVNTPHLKSISATSSQWSGPAYRAKKYVQAAQASSPVNHSVKSPFKHAVSNQKKPQMISPKRPNTPSKDLKEKTALATYHVARAVTKRSQSRAGGQQSPVKQNHLLKAKLKPLYPVKVEGPTLSQCRGIQPQPQAYSDSPSRTLQRRRQLLANMPRELLERPQTVESVHRNSFASEIPGTYGLDTRDTAMHENSISHLDIAETPRSETEEVMEGLASVLIQQNHSDVIIQSSSQQTHAEKHVQQIHEKSGDDEYSKEAIENYKQMVDDGQALFNADDWQCKMCGNVNWSQRIKCDMCNNPRNTRSDTEASVDPSHIRDDTFLTQQTTTTPRSQGNTPPSQEVVDQSPPQTTTDNALLASRVSPRPSTVPDGTLHKAVRFAESVTSGEQPRAKSATAASGGHGRGAVETIHKSFSMPDVNSPIPSISDSFVSSVSHSGLHPDTVTLGISEIGDSTTCENQIEDQSVALAEVESFTSEDITKYVQSTINLCREELAKESNFVGGHEYSQENNFVASVSAVEDKLGEDNQSEVRHLEKEEELQHSRVSCKDDHMEDDAKRDHDDDNDDSQPGSHKQHPSLFHQSSSLPGVANQNNNQSGNRYNQDDGPVDSDDYVHEQEIDNNCVETGMNNAMEMEGNCNNNSNNTEGAEDDMQNVFSTENRAPRKNIPATIRPRSRLGFWEDAYKPDPKFESSVTQVNGKSPTRGIGSVQAKGVQFNVSTKKKRPFSAKAQLESNIYVPAAAARAFGVKARPQSAGGPREFMEQERKRLQRKPMPPSAQCRLIADKDSSEIQESGGIRQIDAGINPVSQAFNRPRSGKPRPYSAKVQSQWLRVDAKSKEEDSEDPFSVHGNKMTQAERETKEVYDVKVLKKGLFESPKPKGKYSKAKRKSYSKAKVNMPNDDAENDEDEVLYIAGFDSHQRSSSPQKGKTGEEHISEGQNPDIIRDIDDLEKWLHDVQAEVRTCVTKAQEAQNTEVDLEIDDKDLVVCDEYEELEEDIHTQGNVQPTVSSCVQEKVPAKDRDLLDDLMSRKSVVEAEGLSPGIISSAIVSDVSPGKHAYEMVVYHFEEEKMCAPISLRKRPNSGFRNLRSRPSSGKRVLQTDPVAPKGEKAGEEQTDEYVEDTHDTNETLESEKPCTGTVSSYSVTMMGDTDSSLPKEVEDEEAFLKMVLEHLPKPQPPASTDVVKGKEEIPPRKESVSEEKLEVVAKPKEIIKPDMEEETKPVAPYPPICFRINARPPPGYVYYFAYGTDMNPYRLQTYIQRESLERQWGLLYGFKLVFNKKGEDIEAGGFPNLDFSPYSSVEGSLYLVTPQELQALDCCIGYPQHYEHVMLPVWLLNCNDPDNFGVAQYCVPALMYIAHDRWTQKDLVPSAYTLDQWNKGADLVTENYRSHMQQQYVGTEI